MAEFSDQAEYKEQELSLNEIILRHIRKISDICCQEFTGGYWNKKPMQTRQGIMYTEEYHEDKRESYSNAVDFLVDIIYPKADKTFQTFINDNDKDDFGDDIKGRQKLKRKVFKQINLMFERLNFFGSSGIGNE